MPWEGGCVSTEHLLLWFYLPNMGRDAFERVTCANQVKFVDCVGKIMVTFSNAAGQQHYEVHGCGISIINV